MTITFGRVSITADPSSMIYQGDIITLAGYSDALNTANGEAFRWQMLGLTAEPFVPVTWSSDSFADGYYQVRAVDITPAKGLTYSQGYWPYTIQLEQVARTRNLFELVAVATTRDDTYAAPTPLGSIGVPDTITAQNLLDGVGSGGYARQVADRDGTLLGNMWYGTDEDFDWSTVDDAFRYRLPPDSYYQGAATVEWYDGAAWHDLHGRMLPDYIDGDGDVRVGNGFIRATWGSGTITLQVFDGTDTWDTVGTFEWIAGTSPAGFVSSPSGARVVRNDPTDVVVEFNATFNSGFGLTLYRTVKWHCQRGQAFITITQDTRFTVSGTNQSIAIMAVATTASTSITGGILQTADGAAGHRFVIMSDDNITKDTTNGGVHFAGALTVGLAAEYDGTNGGPYNDATYLVSQWWAPIDLEQWAVS